MPYMTNGKRDYKKQYEKYDSKDEVKKNRAKRNKARREMERDGKVHKGDGKEVDHKKPLSKGGGTEKGNLRVTSRRKNRSYKRNKDGSMK